jgi:hypothetical protein
MKNNIKARLLIPVVNVGANFRCDCNEINSNQQAYTDYHALNCSRHVQDLSIRRHNDVRDLIYDTIDKHLPLVVVHKELNHYNPEDPRAHKKPDVSFTFGPNQIDTFIDVAYVNSGANSYLGQNNTKLLQSKEAVKKTQHRPSLGNAVDDPERFVPFIVDPLGNIGPLAKQFLISLGSKCNNNLLKSDIMRAISITTARNNDLMFFQYDTNKANMARNAEFEHE